jgi:chromosome segregation ATPase
LQFNFARLLAHAHYLRLECQQLQHTTHYLAQQVLKLNKQNTQTNTKLEDIVEESKTLRAMNVFMQGRMKQLEERVHKGEEDVLAFSQQNIELNQHVKELEKELIDIKAHSKERE